MFYDGSLEGRRVLAARAGAALGYSCRLSGHLTPSTPAPPPPLLYILPLPLQKKLMAKTTKRNILSFTLCLKQGGASSRSRSASTGHMSNEALHGFQQAAA